MRIRVISDIHIDINKNDKLYNFEDDFVVCCGDISGDRISTAEWIQNNMKKGIAIGGNHLGYNEISFDKKDSLTYSIQYLREKFKNSPVYFLENQTIEIENVIFIGCILFTDFKLFNNEEICKMIAHRGLNDFRYVKIIKNNEIKTISTTDQQLLHKESRDFIEQVCSNNRNKKIVVISHHAPSYKSVPAQYKNSMLSAAFASNLEDIIEKYDNLKLWCHGHMHENCDYTLYGTRIICNPRGYYTENPYFNSNGIIVDIDNL